MSNDPKPQHIQMGGTSLYKAGTSRFDFHDPYHLAMTASWPVFFTGFVACFVLINLLFAALYALDPGAIANLSPHSLRDAFFFSMETLATVGYGTMAPASTYGHVIAAIEIVCGLSFTAIMTGLIFVRFSKVKPKILYADNMVVCRHDGKPTLMLRLAYGRSGMLASVDVRLHVLVPTKSAEGRTFRVIRELQLQRSHQPLLALTWSIMHTIDELSPLYGITPAQLLADDMRTIVTLEARDHTLSTAIYDVRGFAASQIKFGMAYQDLVTTADRIVTADVRKLSLMQPE